MKAYNLNQLVSIQVNPSVVSNFYSWYPPKTRFGKEIKPAKIIDAFHSSCRFICYAHEFSENEISDKHQLIDSVVYEKPEVVLQFSDKSSKTLYFNSMEEAISKAKSIQQRAANAIWCSL